MGAVLPALAADEVESRIALRAEAAPADWASPAPPTAGWTPVELPDLWTKRWPGHEGVAWYRLKWDEPPAPAARGLRIDYTSLAAAVYVNGHEIWRDPRLAEPLSRSWNLPRYWRLDAPLLRPGENEIWVRVSGLPAFQPGLGEVRLGDPAVLQAQQAGSEFWSRSIQWVSIGLALVMGTLYGMLWLLRRSEKSYGWFSAFSLGWSVYTYNNVARSPWPFDSTGPFQYLNQLVLVGSLCAFVMFVLEFTASRRAWMRGAVAGVAVLACVLVLAVHGPWQAAARGLVALMALSTFLWGYGLIVHHALATRRLDVTVMALCMMLPLVAGTHDTLLFLRLIGGERYYASPSTMFTLLGISFALTWRMVQGMRMIENFNAELQERVARATEQLAQSLAGQHAAALQQTRMAERMNMVRDLHDGLGMTLSSHMHTLREGGRPSGGSGVALAALQEVSDDLRLIIETSSFEGSGTLDERLVPLRHRTTRLLEATNIDVEWRMDGLDDCRLDGKRSLDFLRVLQEALANVLKHSGATRVNVGISAGGGELFLCVADNGRGMPGDPARAGASGIGIHSMRARAGRLQGRLQIESGPGGTTLTLRCPLSAEAAATA